MALSNLDVPYKDPMEERKVQSLNRPNYRTQTPGGFLLKGLSDKDLSK